MEEMQVFRIIVDHWEDRYFRVPKKALDRIMGELKEFSISQDEYLS